MICSKLRLAIANIKLFMQALVFKLNKMIKFIFNITLYSISNSDFHFSDFSNLLKILINLILNCKDCN